MYNRTNGIASYGKIANFETDPLKQIVMLYDGAMKFLNLAAADIEAKDFAAKAAHSNRALDIMNYLQSVLDLAAGGDVAKSLDNLYEKVKLMTLKASAGPNAALMRAAAEALKPVRDAWEANATSPSSALPPSIYAAGETAAYASPR